MKAEIMTLCGTFGQRMRIARKARGYTLQYVADKIGVSKQVVSKYENDKSMPSSDVLIKMLQELTVSASYLMSHTIVEINTLRVNYSK